MIVLTVSTVLPLTENEQTCTCQSSHMDLCAHLCKTKFKDQSAQGSSTNLWKSLVSYDSLELSCLEILMGLLRNLIDIYKSLLMLDFNVLN